MDEKNEIDKYLKKWEKASNYMGEEYQDYYIVYSKNRDSEALVRSNYDSIINMFNSDKIKYINPCFNHWLCGWVEVIMIHKKDINSLVYAIDNIIKPLNDYPILDENLYSEYEIEENTFFCDNCKKDTYHFEGICEVCNKE